MTAIENMMVELYMAAMVLILYALGCRGKRERNTSPWFYKYCLILEIAVLLSDVCLWYFEYRGKGIFFIYQIVWSANFVLYLVMVLFYSLYLYSYVYESTGLKIKYPFHYFYGLAIFALVVWLSSYWNESIFVLNKGFYPEYTHVYGFVISLIVLLLLPVIVLVIKIANKVEKHMLTYFFIYSLIPLVALAVEIVTGIDCIFYSSTSLSILFIYVGVNQKNRLIAYNQSNELQKKERELRETEQKVMMGNIQPLFIQSVLASIADMALKDPDRAGETTSSFASYLRMNLNSVGKNEPVPFEEEVRHVDSFLELESNIRPDIIKVEHVIEAYNFFLPVLTLQPIVENAIVHGILPKGGGTIKIWSKEEKNSFLIGVEDDGVGFDSTLVPDGVGISNTRDRLEKFCGGTLKIESEKNKGTRAIITISKTNNMTF